MNLLIAILLYLGFSYTPEQVNALASANNEEVLQATHIRDNNLYICNEEGVVFDVTVNP